MCCKCEADEYLLDWPTYKNNSMNGGGRKHKPVIYVTSGDQIPLGFERPHTKKSTKP
jgi:hypothetical protein